MTLHLEALRQPFTSLWTLGQKTAAGIQACFEEAPIKFAAQAFNACRAAKIHDPEHELPALKRLAEASIDLAQAQDRLNKAHATWRRFSAKQDYSDACHGEYHEKFLEAERLLKDTRAVYDLVLREYQDLMGEGGTTVEKLSEAA